MQARLRQLFDERDDLVGSWLSSHDPKIAELIAELGFDFITIDTEHAPNSIETVASLTQAIDAARNETGVIVRVPWNDPVRIKRVLDIGASGVLIPMIETVEDAEAAVRATHYPPDGIRGVGPLRASRYGLDFDEYVETANERILTTIQIETRTGLENVEVIAAVEGIDALFIGPADLSASLGVLSEDDSPVLEDAIERIVTAAHDEGKAVGTVVGSTEGIRPWVERGVDYLNVGSDISYIREAGPARKRIFEDAIAERSE